MTVGQVINLSGASVIDFLQPSHTNTEFSPPLRAEQITGMGRKRKHKIYREGNKWKHGNRFHKREGRGSLRWRQRLIPLTRCRRAFSLPLVCFSGHRPSLFPRSFLRPRHLNRYVCNASQTTSFRRIWNFNVKSRRNSLVDRSQAKV